MKSERDQLLLVSQGIVIFYPNFTQTFKLLKIKCIAWVEEKLKRDGSDYKLTKQDLDDIETAYEFQTSDLN